MLLEGRTALVTGASKGIGAAIARTFATEGARVVLSARGEQADAVAEDIRAQGGQATSRRGDLRDPAFAKDLVMACRKEWGALDVLVNNAGVIKRSLLGMTSLDEVREMFDVNVVALINLTQYALRIMDGARRPSIVNLASIAGTAGTEGLAAYSATKGAVVAFTRASAKELAPRGIRVNAIAPGVVDTEMVQGLGAEEMQRQIASIRMGRVGAPEDIAAVALFLASDLSRYVTGQVLGVDGGMQA